MKLKESTSNREQPAEDTYMARVVALTNLGTQPPFEYQGQMTDPQDKMEVTYELVTTSMKDGRPFWVSEELPISKRSKKLAQRYSAYKVDMDADVEEILNRPVMLTIKHSEKGYANVQNVAGVPSGLPVDELRNPTSFFDPWDSKVDVAVFDSFPEFKRNKILAAMNYKESELFKKISMGEEY